MEYDWNTLHVCTCNMYTTCTWCLYIFSCCVVVWCVTKQCDVIYRYEIQVSCHVCIMYHESHFLYFGMIELGEFGWITPEVQVDWGNAKVLHFTQLFEIFFILVLHVTQTTGNNVVTVTKRKLTLTCTIQQWI